MLALGKSPEREAECSGSVGGMSVGLVCVRSACRSLSSARIQTNVSSRKMRLMGSLVGGMRYMAFALEVDNRLDFERLVQRTSRLHKEVLLRRAQGHNDRAIAAAINVQHKHVPVLVHRAIISLRKMLAKSPFQPALAAG
jgi:hypothetical protein